MTLLLLHAINFIFISEQDPAAHSTKPLWHMFNLGTGLVQYTQAVN